MEACHVNGELGLIPARAGKTVKVSVVAETKKAHPRAGGENGQASASYFAGQGSSPRGRGKRRPVRRVVVLEGLIPARAGKT